MASKGQTSKRRVLPTCIDETGLPSSEEDVLTQPLGVGERQQPDREDEARRYEEERTREERRQREFQQLLTSTMEHQTAANARERQALEELRQREAAEDRVARERESELRRKERELDKKRQNTPHLPRMREDADVEAYLEAFERQMRDLEYKQEEWLVRLRPLLSDWANAETDVLLEQDRRSHSKMKETLLNAYAGAKGGIGFIVVTAERKKGQSASKFMTQLYRQCRQWWQDLSVDEAAVKNTMVVTELQLPLACRNYVQVRQPTSIHQMSTYIESFLVERNSTWDDPRWKKPLGRSGPKPREDGHVRGETQSSSNSTPPRTESTQRTAGQVRDVRDVQCFVCNKKGHFARN